MVGRVHLRVRWKDFYEPHLVVFENFYFILNLQFSLFFEMTSINAYLTGEGTLNEAVLADVIQVMASKLCSEKG